MTGIMLKALNNPLRRAALRLLHRSTEPMSAAQMAKVVKLSANKLSHHLQVLNDLDVVTLVDVQKVRGATEKFFISQVAGHATVELILGDTEEDDRHVKY